MAIYGINGINNPYSIYGAGMNSIPVGIPAGGIADMPIGVSMPTALQGNFAGKAEDNEKEEKGGNTLATVIATVATLGIAGLAIYKHKTKKPFKEIFGDIKKLFTSGGEKAAKEGEEAAKGATEASSQVGTTASREATAIPGAQNTATTQSGNARATSSSKEDTDIAKGIILSPTNVAAGDIKAIQKKLDDTKSVMETLAKSGRTYGKTYRELNKKAKELQQSLDNHKIQFEHEKAQWIEDGARSEYY